MYVDKRKSEINSNQCRWVFGAVSWRVFTITPLYRLAQSLHSRGRRATTGLVITTVPAVGLILDHV